jgi:uncharacterized membrane protein YfcA
VPDPQLAAFLVIVLGAYTATSVLGFGANVLTVALAAHLFPIRILLPAIVPASLMISLFIAIRYRARIRWPILARLILPFALLGFPFGLVLFYHGGGGFLKALFGAVVILLSAAELVRILKARIRPLHPLAARALLVAGGFIQGLFASGGPIIVYVVGREVEEKGEFRATLSFLWILLNFALVASYTVEGELNTMALWTLPPMVLGLLLGEWLHNRIDQHVFRIAVYLLLLVSGLLLVARSV